MTERLYLFDTTLRDGQQTQGVQFSQAEKLRIAEALDALGVDYIEGGWPGANPTDSAFFDATPATRARLTAFGMTKRSGRSAANDDVLAAVLNAGTQAVCLVGKAHEFHVTDALGITLEENRENLVASFAHVVEQGREAIFDAEHFFDGYLANPAYALSCLHTALEAGARWVVLCDTNGGTLPADIARITAEVIASGVPGDRLGIHTHDDTGTAVAGTLAAVAAGARQIQGTLNGLGERCGNANLTTLIPTLLTKPPFADQFTTRVTPEALGGLTRVSRMLDDILNRAPLKSAPYVGASAFAHKAGLHASAIAKNPRTYEHVPPATVGNARKIPMSNQAGQSNLRLRLEQAGLAVEPRDPALAQILDDVKAREAAGYAYDSAEASFELVARRWLDGVPRFFDLDWYRVVVARRVTPPGVETSSEASLQVTVGGRSLRLHAFGADALGKDSGPVSALYGALVQGLTDYSDSILDMRLVDFRVRITDAGTDAVTCVTIDSEDTGGHRWSTVGVSANIIDASCEALLDAVTWKLLHDRARGGVVPLALADGA